MRVSRNFEARGVKEAKYNDLKVCLESGGYTVDVIELNFNVT